VIALHSYTIIPSAFASNNSFLVLQKYRQQKYRPHYCSRVARELFMRDVSIEWYRNRDSRYNMQEVLLTTTSCKSNVSLRIILRRWYS